MNIKVLTASVFASVALSGCALSFSSGEPPPAMVEEPAPDVEIVAETDVPFVAVDEYYFVGGRYYYWHPGVGRYVILRGEPPYGHRILRMEHLVVRDGPGRPAPRREPSRGPAPHVNGPAQPHSGPQHQQQPQNPKQKKKQNQNQ